MERRYVAIDGPPGSGVSALAGALADRMGARRVADPAPAHPFRDQFARDPERFAFQAQIYCLLSRYRQQLELAQPDLFGPVGVVADYVFVRDALYAKITLRSDEFVLYRRIHELLTARLPRPDLVVYLTADREVLRGRIRRLVAASDRVIKLKVVDQLAAEMDDFFFGYDETPLLVI